MPAIRQQEHNHNAHPVYRPDIDGLRAVAILAVLIFHAFPASLPGGFIGVDIFFVISGYLISNIIFRSLQRGDFSFREFYAHRIKRIFPSLIVVLTACYAVGWFLLLPEEYKQLGKHIAAGAAFLQNLALWSEVGYFDPAAELKPLTHLWSLAIEEQFYLVFPFLIWGAWSAGLRARGLCCVLFLLTMASFGLNIVGITDDPTGAFFLAQMRFWELLAGSLLAYINVFHRSRLTAWLHIDGGPLSNGAKPRDLLRASCRQNCLSLGGALLLILGFVSIHEGRSFPGWWAMMPVGGAFLLIMAGPQAWVNRLILTNRIMIFIGLISYPLYLWHWPILSFVRITWSDLPSAGIRWMALLLSIVLSWLTYRYIERPLRFGFKTWVKTAVLVLVMAGLGFAGYYTYKQGGLAFRLPEPVRPLLAYQYDYQKGYREGSCFLRPEQNQEAFGNCTDSGNPDKPVMLLWGDSHAAHLYPGIEAKYGKSWTIRQRNASGCPPIPGMLIADRVHCKDINEFVMTELKRNPPEIVVLAATWSVYDWARLGDTVRDLRLHGIDRIIMVGPVPQWRDGLPKQLLQEFRANPLKANLPERMLRGLDPAILQLDPKLAVFATSLGVEYISAVDILCNARGCLTRVGDGPGDITAWDYGHLTTAASQFLVGRFPIRAK